MKHNRFQQQTDKGWQSMSELLDQKMPVRKRRRPLAWWWTGAAIWLLPLVGTGAWWWMSAHTKPTQQQSPDTQRAVTSPSVVTTTPSPRPRQWTGQNTAAPEVPESRTSQSEAKTPVARAESAKYTQEGAKNCAQPFWPKNITSQQAIPALPFRYNLPDYEKATEGTDAVDNLDMEPALLTTATFTLTPLPAQFQLLENTANTHTLALAAPPTKTKATSKTKKKTPPRQLRIGATLGIATERFRVANSMLGGAALDWQPMRHWGLRSGLMYERYRPSGFARPIAEVDADEYADATRNYAFLFNNGVYVPGTSEALGLDVALPVTMMQRLRVPMLAYWQPAKWLRLYGGSSFSYTLRVHTSSKGLAFDSELVGARSPSSLAKVNKLATRELPRFQAQLQTGLGIRLGRHWEVEMAYRQSAKIQFKSLFEKREEDGQAPNTMNINRKPNHHFFTLGGIYFF